MSAEELGPAQWEILVWQTRVDGRQRDFSVPVLVSPEAVAHPDRQVHKYQPMGEGQRAADKAMAVLRECGLAGVVVDLRYDQLPPEHFERVVREVPTFVACELANGYPVDIQGGSVGGVPAIVAPGEAPEKYSSAGWVSPAGLLNEHLGETAGERSRHLKDKLGWENTKLTLQRGFDFGDLEQVAGIVVVFVRHRLKGQLGASIDGAMDPELAKLTARGIQSLFENHIPLKLLAPEDDPLFPASLYQEVLGALGCGHILEVIPGLHATVRSRAGAEQYRRLAQWTKAQQDARTASSS